MFIFSLTGIAAITFNLLKWNSPLEYLPLHMCSINAMLLPFAVLTKNKTLCNLLVVWCLGALVALVLNQSVMETTILSDVFIFYYFPHIFEFIIPIFTGILELTNGLNIVCSIPEKKLSINIILASFLLLNKLISPPHVL